jgi:hypothetical protein
MEVYPPGDDAGLAIVLYGPYPIGVRTGVILNTTDIDAAHEAMVALGVDVDEAIGDHAGRRVSASARCSSPTPCPPCSGSGTRTATSF